MRSGVARRLAALRTAHGVHAHHAGSTPAAAKDLGALPVCGSIRPRAAQRALRPGA